MRSSNYVIESCYLTQAGFLEVASWYSGYPDGCNHCQVSGLIEWLREIEKPLEWSVSSRIPYAIDEKRFYVGLPPFIVLFCDATRATSFEEFQLLFACSEDEAERFASCGNFGDRRYTLVLRGGVHYRLNLADSLPIEELDGVVRELI